MPHEICFTLESGRRICIPLLVLVEERWRDPNPPDPRQVIDLETLRTLATIDRLAEGLLEPGRAIRSLVADQMQQMAQTAGRGVEIHEVARSAAAA